MSDTRRVELGGSGELIVPWVEFDDKHTAFSVQSLASEELVVIAITGRPGAADQFRRWVSKPEVWEAFRRWATREHLGGQGHSAACPVHTGCTCGKDPA